MIDDVYRFFFFACHLVSALLLVLVNARPNPSDGLSLAANGCSSNCPGEAKVCGTDDQGRTQTFNNLCLLEASNCSNKTSKIILLPNITVIFY